MIETPVYDRVTEPGLQACFFLFMKGINIEIKARTSDLQRVRKILESEGAEFRGTDKQVDTYFRVPIGRLKLRQGLIENNLIQYFRDNQSGPKKSEVVICPVHENSEQVREALAKSCGILVVVDKTREIYYIQNVKFHLDKLSELGSFVEIEVFGDGREEEELWKTCRHYMELLNISEEDLVSNSYSDMLLSGKSTS